MLRVTATPSFERLGRAFKTVAKTNVLHEELERFAKMIEGEGKKASPVDTGRMRASIFSNVKKLSAEIGPTVFYAPFVHWGTKYMKARPFMQWGAQSAQVKLYASDKPPFSWAIENEFAKEFKKL